MCRYRSLMRATGSALVEFVLLLGVLLPVGFGMTMIGKLTDLKQTAEQANRYSAWEATVYSRRALVSQSSDALAQRFFSSPDALVQSRDTNHTGDQSKNGAHENPLWGRSTSQRNGLQSQARVSLHANSLVAPAYNFDTGKASAALLTGKIAATAGRPLANFRGNSWGIVADGLLRSRVDVPVQVSTYLPGSQKACGQSSDAHTGASSTRSDDNSVCMRTAGVILADGWGASGDSHAVSRIRSLVPGSSLSKIGKGVGKLLGALIFPELDPLHKAFGHVDMTVLPRYAKP